MPIFTRDMYRQESPRSNVRMHMRRRQRVFGCLKVGCDIHLHSFHIGVTTASLRATAGCLLLTDNFLTRLNNLFTGHFPEISIESLGQVLPGDFQEMEFFCKWESLRSSIFLVSLTCCQNLMPIKAMANMGDLEIMEMYGLVKHTRGITIPQLQRLKDYKVITLSIYSKLGFFHVFPNISVTSSEPFTKLP